MSAKDMIQTLLKKGFSQSRIARETGITQATISRIASGKHRDTSYDYAKRIEAMVARCGE